MRVSHEIEETDNRRSGLELEFKFIVGYRRIRPNTSGDKWEARVDSIGLILVGSVVVIVLLIIVVPRILAWLSTITI